MVALAPWPVQLWLVDAVSYSYNSAPTPILDRPTTVHAPPKKSIASIASLRQIFSEATAMLSDPTEARPLIQAEMNVKNNDGRQLISGLVYCAATLDCVSKDCVRRFSLPTRKSNVETPIRLANGQRVPSSKVCDTTFDIACHEFQRAFNALRDLRVVNLVVGLS
jgi:hypothetical protein